MAVQSLYQDPPQAQGYWNVNLSKAAVLFWQWVTGQITPVVSTGGMMIPGNDEQIISYVGGSNNISNIVYKNNGAVVATQTFEYKNAGVADDDLIVRIAIS